jgi:hypothetical protein
MPSAAVEVTEALQSGLDIVVALKSCLAEQCLNAEQCQLTEPCASSSCRKVNWLQSGRASPAMQLCLYACAVEWSEKTLPESTAIQHT